MIQFKVSKFLGLSVQVDGMVLAKSEGIQVVFNQADDAEKLWDADTQTVTIPWTKIEHWEVDYGFLSDQLRLKVSSTDVFGRLPGVHHNEVELDISKQQREQLKEFEHRAKEYQSGRRKNDTEEKLDNIRDFLYGSFGDE